jgi:F-type H+-transporting ATPase subunit epsilon
MLTFELVSPERLELAAQATMVVAPGAEGDFGVLPEHAPMISTLRPGVVQVFLPEGEVERVFVTGGFAEVTPSRCTVLAEDIIPLPDLDKAGVDLRLQQAQIQIRNAQTPEEKLAAEKSLMIAEVLRSVL